MIPVIAHPIPRDIPFKAWMETMQMVTVDFETYYDDEYSLTKMAMYEYVQDARFKVQGVSIDLGDNNPVYYRDINKAMDVLRGLDKWVLIAQNTKFEGYILHYHFGIHPTVYADTKSMSKGLWPFESASLKSLCERLWPMDLTKRKGDELIQTKGVLEWSEDLHKTVGEGYCNKDVALTRDAFDTMYDRYPGAELEIIHITCRMYCYPTLRADHALLKEAMDEEIQERNKQEITALARVNLAIEAKGLGYWNPDPKEAKKLKPLDRMIFSSRTRFIKLLREVFDLTLPMKTETRRDGSTYETEALAKNDPEYIALKEENLDLQWLWDIRELMASNQSLSRAKRMTDISKPEKGCELPIPLGYYNAHTGRYSGEEKINMQNLGRGSKHRLAIYAPEGFKVHVSDSSNIEARINAGFAGQEDLLEAFRHKEDVYSMFASDVYDTKITKKTHPGERNVGKVCVLGLGYGMGADTLKRTFASGPMGMDPIIFPDEMVKRMVQTYRSANYAIAQNWKTANKMIELMIVLEEGESREWGPLVVEKNRIRLPNGMYLSYPRLHHNSHYESFVYWNGMFWKRIYGGALIENIVQALARIVVMTQCVEIDRLLQQFGGWIVMQVHDENIGIAKDLGDELNETLFNEVSAIMQKAPSWMPELPLDSEGGFADNYSK